MSRSIARALEDETATAAFARQVAGAVGSGLVIFMHGELGAGKTSFTRALLQALGAGERVKSPTYSLVESYDLPQRTAWHLDLYRIADAGELEWLGLEALADPDALVLVEWPERGQGALPSADLTLTLAYAGDGRSARLDAHGRRGEAVLRRLGTVTDAADSGTAGRPQ